MDTIRGAVSHQGRDPVVVQLGKKLRGLGEKDEPLMGMGGKYSKRACSQVQWQFGIFLTTHTKHHQNTITEKNPSFDCKEKEKETKKRARKLLSKTTKHGIRRMTIKYRNMQELC